MKEQPIKRKEEKNKKSGCRHNWFYSPNTFSKYCPSCHKLESYNPDESVQSGEERLMEALEKIADITLECHTQVEVAEIREIALAATGEIKGQRLFTLKEALEIWDVSLGVAYPKNRMKYFKERYGIDL